MPKSTLPSYDTGDVTSHAPTVGIHYNAAIDFFVKDDILPMVDAPYTDIYKSDCTHPESAYGWSAETCRVMLAFMEKEGIDAFRMQA